VNPLGCTIAGRTVAGSYCLALAATSVGCFPSGPSFESPARVRGVRVLGVMPVPASGSPGGTVALTLEAFDGQLLPPPRATGPDGGSQGATPTEEGPTAAEWTPPAPLSVVWFAGCHNPPGDAQYGCYPGLQQIIAQLPDPLPTDPSAIPTNAQAVFGLGRTFSVHVPTTILAGRQLDTAAPPFGISFVFFAVCRGLLRPDPSQTSALPLRCDDPETGQTQGSEAFVRGFSTVYTYSGVQNRAPSIAAVTIDGAIFERRSCTTENDCADLRAGSLPTVCRAPLAPEFVPTGASSVKQCLPTVPKCSAIPCPRYRLFAELDATSVERDPSGTRLGLPPPAEILWVNYFGYGGLDRDEVLVNDRSSGFNPDYAVTWTSPPIVPDRPLPTWAVIQDNRGGTAIARWDFVVTD
jgi:hypothetical protein